MYLVPVFSKLYGVHAPACLTSALALLLLWSPTRAQLVGEAGEAGMEAIALVAAARPAGLAGAHAAVAEGSSSIGVNPAGLARETGRHFSGSMRPGTFKAGAVAYSTPYAGGRVAFSTSYVDHGEILGVNEFRDGTGLIRPYSIYPGVSYARVEGERWRWGATFKVASETLGDFEDSRTAYGAAVDAGVQYQPAARNIGFGASVTNLGRQLTGHFEGHRGYGPLPTVLRAGAFYQPPANRHLVAIGDVELPFYSAPVLAIGGEYRFSDEWQVRGGTRWSYHDLRNLAGWIDPNAGINERYGDVVKLAGGTTLRVRSATVDYAAQWWRGTGIVHALTLGWALDGR